MTVVDESGVAAWVSEALGDVSTAIAAEVLAFESEWMAVAVIQDGPAAEDWRWWSAGEAKPADPVDTKYLGEEAERRMGIPRDVAWRVYEAEPTVLQMRCLA